MIFDMDVRALAQILLDIFFDNMPLALLLSIESSWF